MKGLDTNVLVRYLTQDDPKQVGHGVKLALLTDFNIQHF
jgi:predicted nucleic-acid-binding protein